ncbi:MAG: serine/threonine protein kinase [Rhodanobacteraceae bacterium]|nr:serine/threonine protein kinase [Rhodanobacteraceae bacterium]
MSKVRCLALLEPGALLGGALCHSAMNTLEPTKELAPNDMVGVYRIREEIGRGGMGIVYRADRADGEFEQSIALKWLPANLFDSARHEIFRRERQILAGLRHIGIAQLLDGGHSDDGHLWFAMELIDGLPLDQHCAVNQLPERERIELLMQLVAAVRFSHSHLLIHSDIKPRNVLVAADGQAKLLDFGVAVLASDINKAVGYSPGFASPEQISGAPIGVSSDIWQLGRMIETTLLAGREQSAALPQDLAAIVACACAPQPEQRYASAGELFEDLRCYLAYEPVRARGNNFYYKLLLFIRRHPWSVSASALSALTFILVVGTLLWRLTVQRAAAERERSIAVAVNRFLVDDFLPATDPNLVGSSDQKVSELAEAALPKIQERFAELPRVAGEVNLIFANTLYGLSRFDKAALALDRAIPQLRSTVGVADKLTVDAHILRAYTAQSTGDPDYAEKLLVPLRSEIVALEGENSPLLTMVDARIAANAALRNNYYLCVDLYSKLLPRIEHREDDFTAGVLGKFSECLTTIDRSEEALAFARRAHEIKVKIHGTNTTESMRMQYWIARPLLDLGGEKEREGVKILQEVLDWSTSHYGPESFMARNAISLLGNHLTCRGRPGEAMPWILRNKSIRAKSLAGDHPWMLTANLVHGQALTRLGKLSEADEMYSSIRTAIENGASHTAVIDLSLYRNLGELRLAQERYADAEAAYRTALEHAKIVFRENKHDGLAVVHIGLAIALFEQGNVDQARQELDLAATLMDGERPPKCWEALVERARRIQ